MGFSRALMIIMISLLVGCSSGLDESGVIYVGGKVMCQDCTQGWNEWVNGGKPMKGVKVSLTCMDKRSRVVYYTSDTTDELGQYDLNVKKYVYGKELDTKRCSVRLVSSPDSVCNIPTDFGGGKSGVKLNNPTSVYRSFIKYMLNHFYYTTPMCDKPDTEVSDSESQDHHGPGGYY
ncbi:pistil-specific extensin-like protein [Vigna unguiculata]|uniref:pistil-specific extensin-like protein n=1 Tax=Vigna unguiculata TaxID=3917 RepID=UPI0010166829|nr:pistil-specific extensin-like protein [Vigna unguiculata]